MTTTINKDGILTIQANSELEAYALSEWLKQNTDLPKGFMVKAYPIIEDTGLFTFLFDKPVGIIGEVGNEVCVKKSFQDKIREAKEYDLKKGE